MPPTLEAYSTRVLSTPSMEEKIFLTHEAFELHAKGDLRFGWHLPVLACDEVRFPERPLWVTPANVPRRGFGTPQGVAHLLHAIAHIEFVAIHLAWDILYRFRDMPESFIADWLGVAYEESLHFAMLRARMNDLGVDYGDLEVHGGLWAVAALSADDVLKRLALVPRTMEARGLDVTPGMIRKLAQHGDMETVAILERILHDEVGHVALGSRWLTWVCAQRGLDASASYFSLVGQYLPGLLRKPLNMPLRLAAGFSTEELRQLDDCC